MAEIEINGKKVTFRLRTVGNNLFLEATHVNGEEETCGNIIHVDENGNYGRCSFVRDVFGFKLNKDGKIKQKKEA